MGPRRAITAPYRVRWQGFDDAWHEAYDPYSFPPQIEAFDLARFAHGNHVHAHRFLGAHELTVEGVPGVRFAVWAPNAERVSVVGTFNHWDGRHHPMSVRGDSGIWELFIPELRAGELYKYEILGRETRELLLKTDPFGALFEHRPGDRVASRPPKSEFAVDRRRLDAQTRGARLAPRADVDLRGASRLVAPRPGRPLLELPRDRASSSARTSRISASRTSSCLPVTEHPLDESWGYQCTGYFAPTRRHGLPDELRELVAELHARGIGVLLDWVPGHFPKDAHALARFDGTPLYEYGDTQKGEHPDWDTLVFNYSRNEVQSFLLSSAICWLEDFHFDGLRVDAVASMLYLDYSRRPHQWTPNQYGGNENLEAIAFLKRLNEVTHGECPGTITIAEESTAWPQVSRPTYAGGLGFSFKWNMGWMHDTLSYMTKDPVHRQFHHNLLTFGPIYAFTRELRVCRCRTTRSCTASARCSTRCRATTGSGSRTCACCSRTSGRIPARSCCSWAASSASRASGTTTSRCRGISPTSRATPACARSCAISTACIARRPRCIAAITTATASRGCRGRTTPNSVLSFVRKDGDDARGRAAEFHAGAAARLSRRRAGTRARIARVLNSDSSYYGGSNLGNLAVPTEDVPCMGYAQSIVVTLPPLAGLVLVPG